MRFDVASCLLAGGCLTLGFDPVAVVAGTSVVVEVVGAALRKWDDMVVFGGDAGAAVVLEVAGRPGGEDDGALSA